MSYEVIVCWNYWVKGMLLPCLLHQTLLFCLHKVISFGRATEELRDENNHYIAKRNSHIIVAYFEMKPSSALTKGNMVYKNLLKPVYFHPTQVMSLKVSVTYIGSNIYVSRDEYLWLCNSI